MLLKKALLIAYPKNLITREGLLNREWLPIDRACNGLLSRFLSAELFKKTHELGEDYWWVLKPTDQSWSEIFLWASKQSFDLKGLKDLVVGFESVECDPQYWLASVTPEELATKLKIPVESVSISGVA